MPWCDRCNDFTLGNCRCRAYRVEDHEGGMQDVYALHKEDAALRFAKNYNENGDYNLMDETLEIKVNGVTYFISAEPDIHYSAISKEDHDD